MYCLVKYLILLKIQNRMDIKRILPQWFINSSIKNSGIKNENVSNKYLSKELQKPIIRKFIKGKVHSRFIDNIRGAGLADMELITKFNKAIRFLLCVIEIYSKYAWVIPLKDKKAITITSAYQKILKESDRKPNKIWEDKDSKF